MIRTLRLGGPSKPVLLEACKALNADPEQDGTWETVQNRHRVPAATGWPASAPEARILSEWRFALKSRPEGVTLRICVSR